MLGQLGESSLGFGSTTKPEEAGVIIINTCSFVEAAKQESIDVILELADYKKENVGQCHILVVAGCMSQRYPKELEELLPEVDLIIGTGEYHRIVELLDKSEHEELEQKSFVDTPKYIHDENTPLVNTSPGHTAWLKVSEGCDRHCTFCIIPTIRGALRSRQVDSLVRESERLAQSGVREINLISQDLSSYGKDLASPNDLHHLLTALEQVDGIDWIRLFYLYPDDLTDQVIEVIANSNKICPYLDMPVQHFSDSILKRMNRQITGDMIHSKISRLRQMIPNIVLRTSLIVGFPGESEDDFKKLLEGVEQARFNHLGVFRYSDEEGTPAFSLEPKVSAEVIEQRYQTIYLKQQEILQEINQKYLGKRLPVLVEGHHPESELLVIGRHPGQAPEIDGQVIINDLGERQIEVGDIVSVVISEVSSYDLVGGVSPSAE
jgi:ribosomal protein S12 methylthiotransferase